MAMCAMCGNHTEQKCAQSTCAMWRLGRENVISPFYVMTHGPMRLLYLGTSGVAIPAFDDSHRTPN